MTRNVVLACTAAATLAAGLIVPIATSSSALAQDAREYQYRRNVPNACPRGLKLAAGACVRTCPAGYQDMGRQCRLRNQSRGPR